MMTKKIVVIKISAINIARNIIGKFFAKCFVCYLFAWHFWTNGSGSTTAYPFQFLAPDRTRVIPDSSLLGDLRSCMRTIIGARYQ